MGNRQCGREGGVSRPHAGAGPGSQMRRLAPRSSHSHLPGIKPRPAAARAHLGQPVLQLPRTLRQRRDPRRERERERERERDPRGAASSRMGQCNCRKKRKDCQELTDVERAIETVISQFHCYAVKGQKEYLTPNEMQELVVQKLPHLGKCVGPLEEKIECMGDPNEAKLEFGEYWDMMGDAAKGCRRK
ncbi:protein S100-A14-like [Vidua chalybeata]|uniref:protein S100-A14-like n=1 Tax=Vidua chalybeata TaxID=81927 RepID=UPI0023A85824|nr:protein S100-A14-like [Vidua chalybeata]